MTAKELRRSARLLEEYGFILQLRYKTFRTGAAWDVPAMQKLYYEVTGLAKKLKREGQP